MALSRSEQRRLAEIEKQLSAEDPRLARMVTDWSTGPSRWRGLVLAAGAAVSAAGLLVGAALIGAPAGIVLAMLGVLAALTVGVRVFWPGRRSSAKRDAKPRGEPGPRPGTELWYPWYPWWWV